MSVKSLAVLSLALGAFAAVSAAEIVMLGLNFYSSNPEALEVKADGTLPDGVRMGKKFRFINPKIKGYNFPVYIDVKKVKTLDAKFIVTGGTGRIVATLSSYDRNPETGKREPAELECTMFEFCDESSSEAPCTFKGWKRFGSAAGVNVSPGDVITARIALNNPAGE